MRIVRDSFYLLIFCCKKISTWISRLLFVVNVTLLNLSVRAIFVWPWKMVSVSVPYLFYQPMDEKIKTWPLSFPAKENPNMEKALFDWPIVLQYDVKAKYRLISRKFFGHWVFSAERSLNQPKATRVCIRSTNQSNRCISVRLLFLFCLRVFISRSHENRWNKMNQTVVSQPLQFCSQMTWSKTIGQLHLEKSYILV